MRRERELAVAGAAAAAESEGLSFTATFERRSSTVCFWYRLKEIFQLKPAL